MNELDAKLNKIREDINFIADCLELHLPKDVNHHDCRLHCIEMSGNKDGDIFLNMDNFFKKKITIQVKYCPICGFEGNEPPEFKLAQYPRG